MPMQLRGLAVGVLSAGCLALATNSHLSSVPTDEMLAHLPTPSTGAAFLAAFAMLAALVTPSVASMSSTRKVEGVQWKAMLLLAIVAGSHLPTADALLKEPAGFRSNLRIVKQNAGTLSSTLRGGFAVDPSMGQSAHAKTAAEVCEMCGVDPHVGLSEDEAKARMEIYGPNQLPSKERVPLWKRFLDQFDDKMVKILLVAAGISSAFAIFDNDAAAEENPWVEPCVIMSILILNACIGVWQESNAEAAIEALSHFNPDQAKVLRESRVKLINAKELVPGDIVEVAVGDKIPADVRVVELQSTTLKAEQAALTGEAASVNKGADYIGQIDDELSTKENIMFSATDLVYGKARGVVIKTGSDTEIGKIAQALTETEDQESPLKEKLDKFGDMLTDIITIICIACWVVNIPQFGAKGLALTGKDEVDWYNAPPTSHARLL